MSEEHVTVDLKDVALIFECPECRSGVVLSAESKADSLHHGGGCPSCGHLLTDRATYETPAIFRNLIMAAEQVPARLRLRIPKP